MSAIVAYIGERPAAPLVFHALGLLEYRGGDCAGIAVRTPEGTIETERAVGSVSSLTSLLARQDLQTSGAAVGHTRRATHGDLSETNTQPLADCTETLSVAHHGEITNAAELRHELSVDGHHLLSDVDSEVIAHLVEDAVRKGAPLVDALERATARLEGSWGIVVLDARTGQIAATAHDAALAVASAPHGTFVASDVAALVETVESHQVLREGDVVGVSFSGASWRRDGREVAPPRHEWERWRAASVSLEKVQDEQGGEIEAQPAVTQAIVDARSSGIADGSLWRSLNLPGIRRFDRVVMLGSGSSLHAGVAIGQVFAQLGRLPVHAVIAGQAVPYVLEPRSLVVALRRAGDDTDMRAALGDLDVEECALLAITHGDDTLLAERADAVIDGLAGLHLSASPTTTFAAQVITGAAIALSGLADAKVLDPESARRAVDALRRAPRRLADALAHWAGVTPALSDEFASAPGFLVLGRGAGTAYAAEGARELRQSAGRWAVHLAGEEWRPGVVENGTPVFVVDAGDPSVEAEVAELTALGARVIRVSGHEVGGRTSGPGSPGVNPPWGPLEAVLPLQLLARSLRKAAPPAPDHIHPATKAVDAE